MPCLLLHAKISILCFGAVSIGSQEEDEQGGGGQQPPVSVSCVFMVIWRESVKIKLEGNDQQESVLRKIKKDILELDKELSMLPLP